ncbi:putative transcription factor bZIP family [Helianthus annuus]|nr:putative transcription factor bZIP family [Helianthus annuus]
MLSEVFAAGNHLFPEETGFLETSGFTPWGPQQTPVLFSEQEPVFSFSSSDNSTPLPKPSNDIVNAMEERKRRRKISNRESARRSRMRKQKHLEDMRSQLNRLKTENRALMNRLRAVNLHGKLVRNENQQLMSESVMLQQKLRDIRHALHLRQLHNQLLQSAWPCNNNVPMYNTYEQNPPSLIT